MKMALRLTAAVLVLWAGATCIAAHISPESPAVAPYREPRDRLPAPPPHPGFTRPDPQAVDPPRSGWVPRPGGVNDPPLAEAPEGSTLVLVGLGLLALPLLLRRRGKRR